MNIFPSGIAEGEAFCNRVMQRKQLANHVNHGIHTIVLAPRRYGKTSLIHQVMQENHFQHEWIDFLSVTDDEQVQDKIRLAGQALLFKLSPELKKITKSTVNFVKSMSPELNLGAMGQSLTLHLASNQKMAIDDMLIQIDHYAQKTGKRAALVFDEFQQVGELSNRQSVEALIRHAVERSKAITYVFSGSNRHLLEEMFSQSTRPLYRLCQAMPVERIDKEEYLKFIQSAAKKKWGKSLEAHIAQDILSYTECHSFYVNGLCSMLWLQEILPQKQTIQSIWHNYVLTNKRIIISDILSLPLNQKKLLQALASEPTQAPFTHHYCAKINISVASSRRAIEYLIKKDIVFVDDVGTYYLLDPAVRYYFLNF